MCNFPDDLFMYISQSSVRITLSNDTQILDSALEGHSFSVYSYKHLNSYFPLAMKRAPDVHA